MSTLDMELSLNYKMQSFSINPPPISIEYLQEIVFEKYDLTQASFYYINQQGVECTLNTEKDYLSMIDIAKDLNLKEIELIIKTSSNVSQKRKESLRNKSTITITPIMEAINEITPLNEKVSVVNELTCDYDYFGDTRNKKNAKDIGTWSNHCNNFKEKKRIYYIKKAKEMQNEDQSSSDESNEEEETNNGKGRKRKLKCKQKQNGSNDRTDSPSDTDESNNKKQQKKNQNQQTDKEEPTKKQKPNGKKGRCKFSSGNRF